MTLTITRLDRVQRVTGLSAAVMNEETGLLDTWNLDGDFWESYDVTGAEWELE
jgi:hypothetical protein